MTPGLFFVALAPLLVIVMAAGQMAGKSELFLGGDRLTPAGFAILVALPQLVAIPLLAHIPRPGGS